MIKDCDDWLFYYKREINHFGVRVITGTIISSSETPPC